MAAGKAEGGGMVSGREDVGFRSLRAFLDESLIKLTSELRFGDSALTAWVRGSVTADGEACTLC
jgi:hypothetical protein